MDEVAGRGPLSELLDHISDNLVSMMEQVSVRLDRVTTALISGDIAEADLIIASDDEVDLIALDTEELCLQTLATQQPVASDLRAIVAAMHIVPAAERAADLVVNIAKATGRLQGVQLDERTRKLILGMSAQGQILFDRCADAERTRDAALAVSVDQLDDVLDDLHDQFLETVLRGGNHGDLLQQQSTQLAMIGRFYERIGDHAENIGERIHYAITGYRAERAAAERARARRDNPDPDAPVIKSRGLAVVDSITEERRIDAIRRDFVANVSHELKTPVAALSLLVESLSGEDDEATRSKLLGHAERETNRLDSIIDDLIELARLEDTTATATRSVSVDEIVAQSVDAASALAERRGIVLSVTGLPCQTDMYADKRQIVRALSSLIDNAVKYSDEGSSVTVGIDVLPDAVELSVRDTGIGIARPELERIFERFYRIDRARSRETGGTGLGLAIVRHVSDNHGGRVLVESKPGEGSTFTMSLPLTAPK